MHFHSLSPVIFFVHCFNLEYNGRYYLKSAPDKFCHVESLEEMVHMNAFVAIGNLLFSGNIMTLILIIPMPPIAYERSLLYRAKL